MKVWIGLSGVFCMGERNKTNIARKIPFHLLSDEDLERLDKNGYHLAGSIKKARHVDVSGLWLWQRGDSQ